MVDTVNQIWPPSAITFQLHIGRNHKVLKAGLTLSCITILILCGEEAVKVETMPTAMTAATCAVVQPPI